MAGADSIILGDGVFSIGGTDIALTRGGGSFTVEREYKQIEADGDYGYVKGRVRKIKSVAKLTLNALELLPANMTSLYPSLDLDTSATDKDVLTAASNIASDDYITVAFTGETLAGQQVYIELSNAINLENIEWPLQDKDEVVPEITYTAAYDPTTRTTEPWQVEFTKGTTYTVTFTVDDGTDPIEGASVTFHNETKTTSALGVAAFTGVGVANNQAYTITAGGYQNYAASVNVVDADVPVTPSMTAV